MIEHVKHTTRNLKRSSDLSALASLTLLLFVSLLLLLFIMPDYLYFSGREFRNFVFSLNYEVVPALIFVFALFPLIIFGKFSFLSFGVSYYHFKEEIKNSSFLKTLLKKVTLSFLYCLTLILIIYFIPPILRQILNRAVPVTFSELFPFPFISFVLFPLLCFSVNLLVWSIIFANLNNLYWQYYLIPSLLAANVLIIGFFKNNSIGVIFNVTLILIILFTLVGTILVRFESKKYKMP